MTELIADAKIEAAALQGNVEEVMHDLINTGSLDNQKIRYFELSEIDFSGKVLTGLTMLQVRLDQCDFTGCTFNKVSFSDCVIARANFSKAMFIDCEFYNTDFVDCDWSGVQSDHMKFSNCAGKSLLDLTKSGSLVKVLELTGYSTEDNPIAKLS